MVHILRERDIPISPLEATIFALGIHEDTGSLTFPRTTVRDAEMLAACMRLGASQALIERYLHNPLTAAQRGLLMRVIDGVRVERVRGRTCTWSPWRATSTSTALSVIAHKVMDLLNCEILLQVVAMEERLFVTARSARGLVDVAALLRAVGGGGHAQAASAVIRDERPGARCWRRCWTRWRAAQPTLPTAADIMSRPVRFIDADTPVAEALIVAQRYGHSGISVKEGDRVVGIAARRDLDKAVRHGLGHAPVKGRDDPQRGLRPQSATVDELRRLMVETNVGRLPIVADEAYERAEREGVVRVDDVVGIATRTDVLAAYQGRWDEEPLPLEVQACPVQPLADLPYLRPDLPQPRRRSRTTSTACTWSGGFVRDLLLGRPNADVDIAVEGDGIEFARRLARELGGRVRAAPEVPDRRRAAPARGAGRGSRVAAARRASRSTSTWRRPAPSSTTTPPRCPRVEHASIRQDLFRRDFTVNAMAISLEGGDFGTVLDFFGGLRDLHDGVIRVLHNLSFIEDPTRIFRAVRYENRYGFRMDEQTRALARGCVDMHLVGDLSSARLRDELVALLGERDVDWTLHRLFELGVARQVHPKLATGERTVALIHRLDGLVARVRPRRGRWSRWRLRLAAVTRNMAHDELFIWLEKLKLRHADGQVVRKSVVLSPRLQEQLTAGGLSDWDVLPTPGQGAGGVGGVRVGPRRVGRGRRRGLSSALLSRGATWPAGGVDRRGRACVGRSRRTGGGAGAGRTTAAAGGRHGRRPRGRTRGGARRGRDPARGCRAERTSRGRGRRMNNVNLLELALLLPVLLVSMMAHEVAHGFVAYRLGDPTAKAHGRLTLNPMKHLDPLGTAMFVITYLMGNFIFGWAKPVPVNPYYFRDHKKGMMLVGLAGPAMNMVMAILLSLLIGILHPQYSTTFYDALFLAFQVNIVLGLFNLVPIPPLDGSRAARRSFAREPVREVGRTRSLRHGLHLPDPVRVQRAVLPRALGGLRLCGPPAPAGVLLRSGLTVRALELDLDVYQGPFDLLFTLILKEEVDIYEVSLVEIILAYLEAVVEGDQVDWENLSEFLVLISALLEIKSRLLLPGAVGADLPEMDPGGSARPADRPSGAVPPVQAGRRLAARAPARAARPSRASARAGAPQDPVSRRNGWRARSIRRRCSGPWSGW